MIKARVLVPLNIRTGIPGVLSNNNTGDNYYNSGEIIEISEIVIGDKYQNNSTWYRLTNGGYVWSGGVDDTNVKLNIKELTSTKPAFDYNQLVKNVPEQWKMTLGKNVKVVIMDSGIIQSHRDLRILKSDYFDFYLDPPGLYDVCGHGTEVAGIIAANTNSNGIRGIAPLCDIVSFKTLSDDGDSASLSIFRSEAQLRKLANDNDVLIVNGSFDLNQSPELDLFFQNLPQNIIFISSAGDDDLLFSNSILYPASLSNIISVGFIRPAEFEKPRRQFNKYIDYVFIGDALLSTSVPAQNNYAFFSLSSMATAIVSGITALLISSLTSRKNINVETIRKKLNEILPLVGTKQNDLITIYKIKNS